MALIVLYFTSIAYVLVAGAKAYFANLRQGNMRAVMELERLTLLKNGCDK